jgi:hypothetical protein
MEDNQKKYLDRVVDIIVRDTRIDYEREGVTLPFSDLYSPYSISMIPYLLSSYSSPSLFSEYCKDTYGLGENEIEYVWRQYTNIIEYTVGNEE